jgi:hypothetical protein
MLGCIQPISSPMMKRMLGFVSWATAALAPTSAVKPTAAAVAMVANTPRGEIALLMVPSLSKNNHTSAEKVCQSCDNEAVTIKLGV